MKIAYLSAFFPYGGFETKFNSDLYFALDKISDIEAFTFYKRYPVSLFPGKKNTEKAVIDAKNIPAKRILDSMNPASYVRSAKKILKIEPDLFITKYSSLFFTPSIGSISKILKDNDIPSICLINHSIKEKPGLGRLTLFKFFLNQFDAFIVNNQSIKDKIMSFRKNAKTDIHPYPFFNDFGENISKNKAKKKLGYEEYNKVLLYPIISKQTSDIVTVFEMFEELPQDFRLVILVDDSTLFTKISQIIRKPEIRNRVRIDYSKFFDHEISVFFSAADLGILLYKDNSFSSLLSLCYNFKLPVIAETNSIYREIIETYGTGLLIEDKNSETIKNEILRYFTTSMIDTFRGNIELAGNDITWDNFAAKIKETYEFIRR